MKNKKIILQVFLLLLMGSTLLHAQSLDRLAISSGGIASDTINGTLGEVFVFSATNGGMTLYAGAQSDTGNAGDFTTGVLNTEKTQAEFMVYPNPVANYVNIQIKGLKTGPVRFGVFDENGRLLLEYSGSAGNNIYTLPVKQLSAGNYYIQCYAEKGETVGRIKFIKL